MKESLTKALRISCDILQRRVGHLLSNNLARGGHAKHHPAANAVQQAQSVVMPALSSPVDFLNSRPVAHVKLLRLGGKLIQDFQPLGVHLPFVSHQIPKQYPPVRTDFAGRDLPLVDQPDQERTRDIQQVGGLLRRQLGVNGDQGHGVPLRHLRQDVDEQPKGRSGDRDRFLAPIVLTDPQPEIRTSRCQE